MITMADVGNSTSKSDDGLSGSASLDTLLLVLIGSLLGVCCGISVLLARRALKLRELATGRAYAAVSMDDNAPVDARAVSVQPTARMSATRSRDTRLRVDDSAPSREIE